MHKSPKNHDIVLVTSESVEDFFARGKKTAKLLDTKEHIQSRRVISCEDPEDLVKFLTSNKFKLMSALRKKPSSITNLSKYLRRSRSAIDKDIHDLEAIGMVKSEYVVNPGHGKCKVITAADKSPIKLQVQAVL